MQEIADNLADGRCVIFAGAGTSLDSGLPDWQGLGKGLFSELTARGQLPGRYQPLLEDLLANRQTVPDAIDLMVNCSPRLYVVQALRRILEPSVPSRVGDLIGKLHPRGIVTTNYDRVLDPTLSPQQYRLTNSLEKLKQVPVALASGHGFLLKIHGDIDDGLDPMDPLVGQGAPFMVLSKGDYAALMQGVRREALTLALHQISVDNSLLFLGYSFGDRDIMWLFRFLAEHCQFPHQSWYVGLKGQALPDLPHNVAAIRDLTSWDELDPWLNKLLAACSGSKAKRRKGRASGDTSRPAMSEEQRRAFVAIGQYLTDLESNDLAERVLSSVVLEEISTRGEFSSDWLASRIAKLVEVGPVLASALAKATISHLAMLKLVEPQTDGSVRTVKATVDTLRSRAVADWEKDRTSFYTSIARRLDTTGAPIAPKYVAILDTILQELCIDFGQGMAEWVHRGVGRELGWQRAKERVRAHFADKEDIRKASAVIDLIFSQPTKEEVHYLYRLLGAAFLANSVRLDPSAVSAVQTTLSSYELFLDTNILLPLVVQEHVEHRPKKEIIEDSRDAGVKLLLIRAMFDEMCGHRDRADRIVYECDQDLSRLGELVDVLGERANVFLQGYVQVLKASGASSGNVNSSSVGITWKSYKDRYTDKKILERLHKLGLSVVQCNQDAVCGPDFRGVLRDIEDERERRGQGRLDRPSVLNENEAEQFCQIYARREELRSSGASPQVWFLSYETVLAKVYQRNPRKWGMPPTFPFSAWVAFLDSRLPWAPKDRGAIVRAILRGTSSVLDLPDPADLVRKKAFGERVATKAEEEAVQFSLSAYQLVTRVERSRQAILARGRLKESTQESAEARKEAVGEISTALNETISRLEQRLARQAEELQELKQRREMPGQLDNPTMTVTSPKAPRGEKSGK